MYRLKIVAGPKQGRAYKLMDRGLVRIGRQAQNDIVLSSSRVSKSHCLLVVDGDRVHLSDPGSANGTFVNGVQAREIDLKSGDLLSIGEYVLRLSKQREEQKSLPNPATRNHLALVDSNLSGLPALPQEGAPAGQEGFASVDEIVKPQDFVGRLNFLFERYVMPFFYGLNLKTEWRNLVGAVFGFCLLFVIVLSIFPLVAANHKTIVKEAGMRAQLMARRIVEDNAVAIASGQESRASVGLFANEPGVSLAVLMDLDNRILAPTQQYNQYLSSGGEAVFARKVSVTFKSGRETGFIQTLDERVVAIEPLKIFDQNAGRNVTVGMAMVSIDTAISSPGWGTTALIYANSMIVAMLIGLVGFLIIYRLSNKRFELLNEDIDRILKGEGEQIANDFKWSELNSLYEVLGSALQRIPSSVEMGKGNEGGSIDLQDFIRPLVAFSQGSPDGLAVFDEDKTVLHLNEIFEEVTGIRLMDCQGQALETFARDEAFSGLIRDLFKQVEEGSQEVQEPFEFSGEAYLIRLVHFGNDAKKGFAMLLRKASEGA